MPSLVCPTKSPPSSASRGGEFWLSKDDSGEKMVFVGECEISREP